MHILEDAPNPYYAPSPSTKHHRAQIQVETSHGPRIPPGLTDENVKEQATDELMRWLGVEGSCKRDGQVAQRLGCDPVVSGLESLVSIFGGFSKVFNAATEDPP